MGELPVVCVTAFETSSAADPMSAGTAFVPQSSGGRSLRGVSMWTLEQQTTRLVPREGPPR